MSAACQKQMLKIVKDVDMENIQEDFNGCHLELEKHNFVLGSVIDVVVSQVMFALRDGGVQLIRDVPEEVKTLYCICIWIVHMVCHCSNSMDECSGVILLSTINHRGNKKGQFSHFTPGGNITE
ncbi:hypothetical protein Hanom_Chr03g00205171 [Helianthus anomalus]